MSGASVTIFRVLKMGFQNFWRNIWLSLATTGVMLLTIFSLSLLAILSLIGDAALKHVQEKVDVSVYLSSELSERQIENVKRQVEVMGEVKSVTYISKEDALDNFKADHGDNPLILDSINELSANPLRPTLKIKANLTTDYQTISDKLLADEFQGMVEKVNYKDNQGLIERISHISDLVRKTGGVVVAVFSIIAILVMFNTIRLTMYTQKEEIAIMRLVGARNVFISFPYIIEGVMYGIVASIFCVFLLFPTVRFLGPRVNTFFDGNNFELYPYFIDHLWMIIGLQLLFSFALGILSSTIAIRRYLKV